MTRVTRALAVLPALACKEGPTPGPSIAAQPVAIAVAGPAETRDADAREAISTFCVDAATRMAVLESAWPEDGRVYLCAHGDPSAPADAPPQARVCMSVGAAGDYRAEAAPTPRPRPALPFAALKPRSLRRALAFVLRGGKRTPHGAVGTLSNARTGLTIKRAAITYDEHLAFDGWIGDGIVLRTWVDEGPGCARYLVDPTRGWPGDLESPAVHGLGGCYVEGPSFDDGAVTILVDGDGSGVTYVDQATLATTTLTTERMTGPDFGSNIMWGDRSEITIAYGNDVLGDVVRIDLVGRRIVADLRPPLCRTELPRPSLVDPR